MPLFGEFSSDAFPLQCHAFFFWPSRRTEASDILSQGHVCAIVVSCWHVRKGHRVKVLNVMARGKMGVRSSMHCCLNITLRFHGTIIVTVCSFERSWNEPNRQLNGRVPQLTASVFGLNCTFRGGANTNSRRIPVSNLPRQGVDCTN